MTTPTRKRSADPLKALLTLGVSAERSDSQLLELYRSGSSEADEAFRLLLERHGPMVHAVCRRLIRDRDEADDAFQAVFLVLLRRAGSIRKAESLGPWLHGVAIRVARRARRRSADRERRLSRVDPARLAARVSDPEDGTARIHVEIDRLPERYRGPIVLCGLEGLSYEQAARTLGLSEPALRGRLQRGRRRLEAKLRRQGVAVPGPFVLAAPPGPVVQALLAYSARPSSVPLSISSLAKGTLVVMTFASWKPVVFSSLATLGVVGGGVLAQQPGASLGPARPAPSPVGRADQPVKPPPPAPPPPTKEEIEAGNVAIHAALSQTHDFDFPEGIELGDLLKRIRVVTSKPGSPGVPIYVDPVGLSVRKHTMSTSFPLQSKGRPIADGLRDYLAYGDLGFVVKDGMLTVTSRAAAAESRLDLVEEKLDRLTQLLEERLPGIPAPAKAGATESDATISPPRSQD